jgi:hypothetical protein
MHWVSLELATAGLLVTAVPALAQSVSDEGADSSVQFERPFLYLSDPGLPPPLHATFGTSTSYSSSGAALRPLGARFDRQGLVQSVGAEVAVAARLSLAANGFIASQANDGTASQVAVQAGARVLLTDPRARQVRLTLAAGALRDFRPDWGGYAELSGSTDLGALRFAATAHAEKMFGPSRDAIDLYGVLGASLRVLPGFRLGVEYVAQDIEEAFGTGDEGGPRQFVGPNASFNLDPRWVLSGGPALGIGPSSPPLLARASLTLLY